MGAEVSLEQLERASLDAPQDLAALVQYCRAWEAAGNDYAGRRSVSEWIADFHGQESGWPLRQIAGFGRKAVPALAAALEDPLVRYGALMCLRLLGPQAVAATTAVCACLPRIDAERDYELGVALEALCAIGGADPAPIVEACVQSAQPQQFLRGLSRTVNSQQVTPAGMLALESLALLAVGRPPAVALLRDLYLHAVARVALRVLETVASVGSGCPGMVRLVARGLRDARPGVSEAARAALAGYCDDRPDALQGVIEALRMGWMSPGQAAPFDWEAERNARTAIPALLAAIQEGDRADRGAAARQLQKLLLTARPRRAALEAQLADPDRARHARSNLDKLARQLIGVEAALRLHYGFEAPEAG